MSNESELDENNINNSLPVSDNQSIQISKDEDVNDESKQK